MSKAKKERSGSRTKQLCFFPEAPLRPAEEVDAEVLQAIAGVATGLPGEIVKALRRVAQSVSGQHAPATEWDAFKANRSRINPKVQKAIGIDRLENDFIEELVVRAAESGFWLALQRYSKHLRGSREAMAFLRARAAGADKGRAVQQRDKASRSQRIQAMFNSGMEPPAIAADLQCSISTVYRALQCAGKKTGKASTQRRGR